MRNNILLRTVQVLGFILTVAFLPSAHAVQTITLSLPDCPGGQALTFDSLNHVLGCGGTVPVLNTPSGCSITSNPVTSAQNPLPANNTSPVSLTAYCTTPPTGAPTGPIIYDWSTGDNDVNSISVTPTTTTTYTVTPRNADGPGAPKSATVYVAALPGNCSATQSPNPVNPGASVTLTTTCSSGSPPTSCDWGTISPLTTCSVTITAPSTVGSNPYTVIASNSTGQAAVNGTINVAAAAGLNLCTSSDLQIPVSWPTSGQSQAKTNGFSRNTAAFKLTVPLDHNNPFLTGYVSMVEVPGALRTSRDLSISRNACDFDAANALLAGPGGTSPAFSYTIGNPDDYQSSGAAVNFQPGEVIYVNVRNWSRGTFSCAAGGNCNILFNLKTPGAN